MIEKIYEKMKSELSFSFPTGLLCVLAAIYFLYSDEEIAKLLAIYFQPDTIEQIETCVLMINKILLHLCAVYSICVIGLRLISAGAKKMTHEENRFSDILEYIADELDDLLCSSLPAFVVSVLLVLILVHSETSVWTPVSIGTSELFTVMYVIMWIQHAARMSQYK